jgi:uncharacterized protein VirK/YbjX
MALQRRFWGALNPRPKFWLTGIAFLAVYLALNLLTERLDVDRLAITSWSPDNGLSLVLLIESVTFVPFVFLGAVFVDIFVAGVRHSIYVTVMAEFLLASVYASLALAVREKIKSRLLQINLADIVKLLIAIPGGAIFSSIIYCTVLYVCGAFPSNEYLIVMRRFMLGDILGIVTVIIIIPLLYTILSIFMALSTVYHEEKMEGTTYSATLRVLAALRIVLFPGAMFKFKSLNILNKLRNPTNKCDPLYFLAHKYYLSKRITLRQRVRAAMDHHKYENQNYDHEYVGRVYHSDGLLLWQRSVDNFRFTIVLVATEDNRHEGDLSVILYVNNTRLCRMSFCYLNSDIFGLSSGMMMLISRNQTDRTPARTWFEQCFGQNTPHFFCLSAVCGIAVSNETKGLLAIKHDSQIAYEKTFDSGFRNSYTALWERFDAVEIGQHVYMLGVPLNLRPLQSVDSGHRARARNRRRYWDDVLQSACSSMVNYRIASKS